MRFIVLLLLLAFSIAQIKKTRVIKPNKKLNYYDILGVNEDADLSTLTKSYHDLALKLHPDKAEEAKRDKAQSEFIRVVTAYSILSDHVTRKRYDILMKQGEYEYDEKRDYTQFDLAHGIKSAYGSHAPNIESLQESMKKSHYGKKKSRFIASFIIMATLVISIPSLIWLWNSYKKQINRKHIENFANHVREEKASLEEKEKLWDKYLHEVEDLADEQSRQLLLAKEEYARENNITYSSEDEKSPDEDSNVFKCSTCKKSYKTSSQLSNHQQSRSHINAMRLMAIRKKKAMRAGKDSD